MAPPLARAGSAASRHGALAEGAALGAGRLNRRLVRRALARRDPAPGRSANGPRSPSAAAEADRPPNRLPRPFPQSHSGLDWIYFFSRQGFYGCVIPAVLELTLWAG